MINTFQTKLSAKTQLNIDTFLFTFTLLEPKELIFQPGQYMILMVPQNGKQEARRLYSIPSSSARTDGFDLLVELVSGGIGSEFLKNLKIGDVVIFQGPAGMFTLRETGRPRIFLATGTGIAPMLSMIDGLINSNIKYQISNQIQNPNNKTQNLLFWGMKYFKDIYLLDQLKSYKLLTCASKQDSRFEFKICLSREESLDMVADENRQFYDLGHIDVCMERKLLDMSNKLQDFDYYLCGSRNMVETLRQTLYQKGIPQTQVFFEKF